MTEVGSDQSSIDRTVEPTPSNPSIFACVHGARTRRPRFEAAGASGQGAAAQQYREHDDKGTDPAGPSPGWLRGRPGRWRCCSWCCCHRSMGASFFVRVRSRRATDRRLEQISNGRSQQGRRPSVRCLRVFGSIRIRRWRSIQPVSCTSQAPGHACKQTARASLTRAIIVIGLTRAAHACVKPRGCFDWVFVGDDSTIPTPQIGHGQDRLDPQSIASLVKWLLNT